MHQQQPQFQSNSTFHFNPQDSSRYQHHPINHQDDARIRNDPNVARWANPTLPMIEQWTSDWRAYNTELRQKGHTTIPTPSVPPLEALSKIPMTAEHYNILVHATVNHTKQVPPTSQGFTFKAPYKESDYLPASSNNNNNQHGQTNTLDSLVNSLRQQGPQISTNQGKDIDTTRFIPPTIPQQQQQQIASPDLYANLFAKLPIAKGNQYMAATKRRVQFNDAYQADLSGKGQISDAELARLRDASANTEVGPPAPTGKQQSSSATVVEKPSLPPPPQQQQFEQRREYNQYNTNTSSMSLYDYNSTSEMSGVVGLFPNSNTGGNSGGPGNQNYMNDSNGTGGTGSSSLLMGGNNYSSLTATTDYQNPPSANIGNRVQQIDYSRDIGISGGGGGGAGDMNFDDFNSGISTTTNTNQQQQQQQSIQPNSTTTTTSGSNTNNNTTIPNTTITSNNVIAERSKNIDGGKVPGIKYTFSNNSFPSINFQQDSSYPNPIFTPRNDGYLRTDDRDIITTAPQPVIVNPKNLIDHRQHYPYQLEYAYQQKQLLDMYRADPDTEPLNMQTICHIKPENVPMTIPSLVNAWTGLFPWTEQLLATIQGLFFYAEPRPIQALIINALLGGNNVFALMPTGGGKSLCYQLPALLLPGCALVISPLLSLMEDQVLQLRELDIPSAFVASNQSPSNAIDKNGKPLAISSTQIADCIQSGDVKILYITPEKLHQAGDVQHTLNYLAQQGLLSFIAIDEAHCVSQWGHEFRTSYLALNQLRNWIRVNVPILALTATATANVVQDVIRILNLNQTPINPINRIQLPRRADAGPDGCLVFKQSFNRANLTYELRLKPSKKEMLTIIADRVQNPQISSNIRDKVSAAAQSRTIVYCTTQNECKTTCNDLAALGLNAFYYHAGLTTQQRNEAYNSWRATPYGVICCTIAFGMGINYGSIRNVIHVSLPKSIEGYYQECGRAGRDNADARCLLFFAYSDVTRLFRMMNRDGGLKDKPQVKFQCERNIHQVTALCENPKECRRVTTLKHFGERPQQGNCEKCDNCIADKPLVIEECTAICFKICQALKSMLLNKPCYRNNTGNFNEFFEQIPPRSTRGISKTVLVGVLVGDKASASSTAAAKKKTTSNNDFSRYSSYPGYGVLGSNLLHSWETKYDDNDIQRLLSTLTHYQIINCEMPDDGTDSFVTPTFYLPGPNFDSFMYDCWLLYEYPKLNNKKNQNHQNQNQQQFSNNNNNIELDLDFLQETFTKTLEITQEQIDIHRDWIMTARRHILREWSLQKNQPLNEEQLNPLKLGEPILLPLPWRSRATKKYLERTKGTKKPTTSKALGLPSVTQYQDHMGGFTIPDTADTSYVNNQAALPRGRVVKKKNDIPDFLQDTTTTNTTTTTTTTTKKAVATKPRTSKRGKKAQETSDDDDNNNNDTNIDYNDDNDEQAAHDYIQRNLATRQGGTTTTTTSTSNNTTKPKNWTNPTLFYDDDDDNDDEVYQMTSTSTTAQQNTSYCIDFGNFANNTTPLKQINNNNKTNNKNKNNNTITSSPQPYETSPFNTFENPTRSLISSTASTPATVKKRRNAMTLVDTDEEQQEQQDRKKTNTTSTSSSSLLMNNQINSTSTITPATASKPPTKSLYRKNKPTTTTTTATTTSTTTTAQQQEQPAQQPLLQQNNNMTSSLSSKHRNNGMFNDDDDNDNDLIPQQQTSSSNGLKSTSLYASKRKQPYPVTDNTTNNNNNITDDNINDDFTFTQTTLPPLTSTTTTTTRTTSSSATQGMSSLAARLQQRGALDSSNIINTIQSNNASTTNIQSNITTFGSNNNNNNKSKTTSTPAKSKFALSDDDDNDNLLMGYNEDNTLKSPPKKQKPNDYYFKD